ncbi:MAG: hypothetical protein ABJH57_10490 [Cyclobacteriaceae bacterium]
MATRCSGFYILFFAMSLVSHAQVPTHADNGSIDSDWIKIDDFETSNPLENWTLVDTQNETNPKVENPQVTEVRDEDRGNHYLIKKPAAEGVVGNRKAISFRKLPTAIAVGETSTLYVRINVEYFPNNHVFGLSNMEPDGIIEHDYNAMEPTLRVTDRYDANIDMKNDGTLLVRKGDWYDKIYNSQTDRSAEPMETNTWYEVWCVINNNKAADGGQSYDVYIKGGGEFAEQQKVYSRADFRMKREQPIIYFQATCNTGSVVKPYGNGGLRYDDLYMAEGVVLTTPVSLSNLNSRSK